LVKNGSGDEEDEAYRIGGVGRLVVLATSNSGRGASDVNEVDFYRIYQVT
jgi:hypothetical protein